MLMPKTTWTGLADGSITVAFRRWKRPTVKADGTLRTAAGLLAIDAVDPIDEADITAADARSAGHGSVADVLAALQDGPDRTLKRLGRQPQRRDVGVDQVAGGRHDAAAHGLLAFRPHRPL